MKTQDLPRVPRLCDGGLAICLGGGPSLTPDVVEQVRGRADVVIAINNAFAWAPWATALFAADARWWRWNTNDPSRPDWRTFAGQKYTMDRTVPYPDVVRLKMTGMDGIDWEATGVRSGQNSGYAAINLAIHMGATTIALLGYDLQDGPTGARNFHTQHKVDERKKYAQWREHFHRLPSCLEGHGIQVINCTPGSALTCFEQRPLAEALAVRSVAA